MAQQETQQYEVAPALARRFVLRRDQDVSGVSGTGVVAEGVEFWDGKVAVRWRSLMASTALYDSMEDVVCIHGHEGKTRVSWIDSPEQSGCAYSHVEASTKG